MTGGVATMRIEVSSSHSYLWGDRTNAYHAESEMKEDSLAEIECPVFNGRVLWFDAGNNCHCSWVAVQ